VLIDLVHLRRAGCDRVRLAAGAATSNASHEPASVKDIKRKVLPSARLAIDPDAAAISATSCCRTETKSDPVAAELARGAFRPLTGKGQK